MKSLGLILTLIASPAAAVDACLVGQWQIDGTALAAMMGNQLSAAATFTGGGAQLDIAADGAIRMQINDLSFNVVAGGDMPAMDVTISGATSGTIAADDGATYQAIATDYALVGSADIMGQRLDIPVTTETGAGWGNSTGTYACDGDTVQFMAEEAGSIPPRWQRLR